MAASFPWGWWSFDLGKYRRCDDTYALYTYESLPPLDPALLRGDFAWLTPVRSRRKAGKPAPLFARAAALGLTLPPAFERFMSAPELRAAVPSCTACEWDPSSAPVPCRVVPGAFTVRVLRDQQDCLFWYIHLLPDGDAHVLCSPIPFDDPALAVSPATVEANTWWVAPDLETFVYRFWIENTIWGQLNSRAPELTPEQREYLEFYSADAGRRGDHPPKLALRGAKKATAPRPIKRTAAARLAAQAAREGKRA